MNQDHKPPTIKELETIALFPLADAVLFPDTLLPLHVFEPRYRQMLEFALEHNSPIAIAKLKPGFEENYLGNPEIYRTCGVGRVSDFQRSEDGRYDIVLSGVARVVIEEEIPDDSRLYRVAKCKLMEAEPEGPEQLKPRLVAVHGLLMAISKARPRLSSVLGDVMTRCGNPEAVCNMLSSLVLESGELRQQTLEIPSLGKRLDLVLDALCALLPKEYPAENCC